MKPARRFVAIAAFQAAAAVCLVTSPVEAAADEFTFNGMTRSFETCPARLFPGGHPVVKITAPDYRYGYAVTTDSTALPAISNDGLGAIAGLIGAAPTPKGGAFEVIKPPPSPKDQLAMAAQLVNDVVDELTGEQPVSDGNKLLNELADATKTCMAAEGDSTLRDQAASVCTTAKSLKNHIDMVNARSAFAVRAAADTMLTINVTGTRLMVTAADGNPANHAPANRTLKYDAGAVLATLNVEVHSLTRAHVAFGLSVVNVSGGGHTYSVAQDSSGASVIRGSRDIAIVPMLMLSHWWCPVDPREGEPWDVLPGKCDGRWNFLPRIAVGIPLSRSPLENFYVGAIEQLVSGIAFVAGVSYQKVSTLSGGFQEGTPVPADFHISDNLQPGWKPAFFVGVALTDAAIIKVVGALAK